MDKTSDDKTLEQGQYETPPEKETADQDLLAFEEIVVEELSIDGICGVY